MFTVVDSLHPDFSKAIYDGRTNVAFFCHGHEEEAQAYCDWRNQSKFNIGDRVRDLLYPSQLDGVVTRIEDTPHYWVSGGMWAGSRTAEQLELASPQPKWEWRRATVGWEVFKTTLLSPVSTLHSESLAQQVADLLNAQEAGE